MDRKRDEPTSAVCGRKRGPFEEEIVGSGVARVQALWVSSSSFLLLSPKSSDLLSALSFIWPCRF